MAWALEICPKFAVPAVAAGAFQFAIFNTFSASPRNWTLKRSFTLKVRKMARSISLKLGWLMKFRGELPSTGAPLMGLFLTNAAVLNQQTADPTGVPEGQDPLKGSPTSCARSVPLPSRLASAPLAMVNGKPLCIFKIGEMDQPRVRWRSTALSPP